MYDVYSPTRVEKKPLHSKTENSRYLKRFRALLKLKGFSANFSRSQLLITASPVEVNA
jgi:hypothetical protein